jgi:aminopeptidase N
MVVGIGRFARTRLPDAACRVKCVPLTVWTFPQDSGYAVTGPFRRAGQIIEYYSNLIGPFPFPSLAHVESTTRYGGMENATAIFYDEKRYRTKDLGEPVVAHETAHQWFGDAVTEADWHHVWLSEGFANYLEALWRAHADGDSAFRATMQAQAAEYYASKDTGKPILDPSATDLTGLLNHNNYQKAAWLLHQLRGLMGDSAFFGGLRRYYTVYRDSTALSSDFARIMSQAAGRDLEWYFRQALTQPGYPVLEVRWKHQKKQLAVDIVQTQPEDWGAYRIPGLEIRVDGKSLRVDLNGRQTRQVLDGVTRKPKRVEVDPDGWWLLKVKSVNGEG